MGFGDRFNQWLVGQGKEPVSDEMVQILNEAGQAVADDLRENKDDIVKMLQRVGAAFSLLAAPVAPTPDFSEPCLYEGPPRIDLK